ncbi:rRNA methyltransferase 2, mitochondrial [Hypsibius exemplaris]|uniref:rRNA methyltransferase 2, mitochondrial n=1 Tax=Hypsibius exemplaris TaxID=2072580 RepID=A0A1W0WVK5_HYPEX|nr:rRNA methyltransferase 2, mitochondrial [Hypsibius exemplaris]
MPELLSAFRTYIYSTLVRRKSSHDWLQRQARDPYVKKARIVSYRARSAFKLLEVDERFKIFAPGQVVVDLGASPGSWCQVAVKKVNAITPAECIADRNEPTLVHVLDERVRLAAEALPKRGVKVLANLTPVMEKPLIHPTHGLVIGVDLLDILPYPGAVFLPHSDFTKGKTKRKILEQLAGRPVDVVLSDMAPNASGISQLDHEAIVGLCTEALRFGVTVLREGGTFLCKIWTGSGDQALRALLRTHFAVVRNVKPPASRDESSELYLLGTGFKGLPQQPVEKINS